jgi:hypothetical protein
MALEGNRLLSGGEIALESSTAKARRWSRFTALVQWPWQPLHARLRPAARARSVVGPRELPDDDRSLGSAR